MKLWYREAILVIVPLVLGSMPGVVQGYDNEGTHQHVVREAAELFSFPALDLHLGGVMYGAWCEDENDHVYDTSWEWKTITHFWVADDGDDQLNDWGGYSYPNAWMKARILMNMAIEEFEADQTTQAYHYLGHVCHLLADMTVPAHAHYDEHADDAYENWMVGYHANITSTQAATWGTVPEITDGLLQYILGSWGGVSSGPLDLVGPLYFLMYTANQRADYFASDDDEGNLDDRHGWMDYAGWPDSPRVTEDLENNDENDDDVDGDLSAIAYKTFTYAIGATARLYEAWRDHFDHEPPQTAIAVSGPDPVHDGWRPGSVTVTLTADDNSGGSGVFRTRYGHGGTATLPYTDPVLVDYEGISFFNYQSIDWFGNEEELEEETLKIDRTVPEVSIFSPDPAALYLTSSTLTVEFAATDHPSGVYSLVADLDGIEITDGTVLDLDLMGGHRVLTVTATDMAGNVQTGVVEFSITIDATVDVKPESFNLRSSGGSMKATVAFPPPYSVDLIEVPSVCLNINSTMVPVGPWPASSGHNNPAGVRERLFGFEREPVCGALPFVSASVAMSVTGNLSDGTDFLGTDIVEVIAPGNPKTSGKGDLAPAALDLRVMRRGLSRGVVLEFALPVSGKTTLQIYDVMGRLIGSLQQGNASAGTHRVDWEAVDGSEEALASGIYFVRLMTDDGEVVRRVLITK